MKSSYKMWLKRVSMLTLLVLLVVAAAAGVSAQRKPKRGGSEKRIANYGGSALLRKTAVDNGYAEGVREGRTDLGRGESFNFTDESGYQSAAKGYSSRLGEKSLYRRYFRAAFENGYREGWNGY
jgi:hypothetical protein